MQKRMILISSFLVLVLILTGCRSTPFDGQSVIDWVDFIKWDGKTYDGIHSGALADERYIGEKLGTVQFKVADNVTNPNYKLRNGDAAFHEKGTEIYRIKDHPHLIAVKSAQAINGYRVYFSRDDMEFQWHFKDMPVDQVKTIEIYKAYTQEGNLLITEWMNHEDVKSFLHLLGNSEEKLQFEPNTENGDPVYYEMVFYTEEPIAYKYGMQYDGDTYFWHPWDTSIVSEEIDRFFRED